MKTTFLWFLVTLAVAAGGLPATAGQPTSQIRSTTDKILALLNAPELKGDARRAERRRRIREELDQRFDWQTIARSCLGRHWSKRTHTEKAEFASLFSRFLEQTYLDKFEVYYGDLDRIDYQGERTIGDYAQVKVLVTTKNQISHPVEYRLQHAGDAWHIYDVLIEGVSLVKNYRDQFDEIIARSSYEKLVADLKAKQP